MEFVVNDTNIFIDLISIDLLDEFFNLPFEFHTMEFVLDEITSINQSKELSTYVKSGKLKIKRCSGDEVIEINQFQNTKKGNVSFTDCAVLKYAKDNNYTLLTGDKCLRKNASESGVTVKGILYIFDSLVECNIINTNDAITKLTQLNKTNKRLPQNEIQERINKWMV